MSYVLTLFKNAPTVYTMQHLLQQTQETISSLQGVKAYTFSYFSSCE